MCWKVHSADTHCISPTHSNRHTLHLTDTQQLLQREGEVKQSSADQILGDLGWIEKLALRCSAHRSEAGESGSAARLANLIGVEPIRAVPKTKSAYGIAPGNLSLGSVVPYRKRRHRTAHASKV